MARTSGKRSATGYNGSRTNSATFNRIAHTSPRRALRLQRGRQLNEVVSPRAITVARRSIRNANIAQLVHDNPTTTSPSKGGQDHVANQLHPRCSPLARRGAPRGRGGSTWPGSGTQEALAHRAGAGQTRGGHQAVGRGEQVAANPLAHGRQRRAKAGQGGKAAALFVDRFWRTPGRVLRERVRAPVGASVQ